MAAIKNGPKCQVKTTVIHSNDVELNPPPLTKHSIDCKSGAAFGQNWSFSEFSCETYSVSDHGTAPMIDVKSEGEVFL